MARTHIRRSSGPLQWTLIAGTLLASADGVRGTTRVWTNASGDGNWNTALNWSGNSVPDYNDVAQFNATSNTNCKINITIYVLGLTIGSTYTGTVTQTSSSYIVVGTSGFNMEGGNFVGATTAPFGNGLMYVIGSFGITGGNFTSPKTLYLSGDAKASRGTFVHNTGTVYLIGNDKTVVFGDGNLYDLDYIMGNNSVTVSGTVNVAHNFTIESVNYMNSGTIAVAGDVTSKETNLIGYPGTVVLFNGSGNQTLTAAVANAEVPSVQVNKPSGTLSVVGPIGVFNDWTHTSGDVAFDSQPLQFVGYDKTITAGTMTYNNVVFDTGGNSITTSGTMNVSGTFTIKSINYMNGGTIACKGNVVTLDSDLIGYPATVLRFDGTGNQTLSANGSYNLVPSVDIKKSSGTLTIQDSVGVFNDFTYESGTVDASNGTIKFVGFDKTITTSTGMTFNNVEIATGGNSVTVAGAMKISGNLTITSVNYFEAAGNGSAGSINVGGNLTSSDTEINSWYGVPIVLDGSGDQLISSTANGTKSGVFPRNITINKVRCTGGEVKLAQNLKLSQYGQVLTIAEGTLNIQGYSLTVNGSTGKFVIERGGILKLDSGAVITTSNYSPEVQCGSMVAVNSGSTFLFPSNTTGQINGTGGNSNWTLTQTCVQGDTPAYCPGTKSKVTSWREVKNAS